MTKENAQALAVFKAFNQRVIAFYPIFVQITGSVTAGLLLSQLVYWAGVKEYGEFYKTDKELMEETMLGRKELIGAKKLIREFFDTKVRGTPHKTFYQIKIDVILAKIEQSTKMDICKVPKGDVAKCQKETTIIQRLPTEITTDILQREAPPKKEIEKPEDDGLNSLMEEFKTVNPHFGRLYPNKSQRAALARLKKAYGEEALRAKIRFLEKSNETPYAPIATTPVELEAKISKIEAFWNQKKRQQTEKANQDDGHRFTHDGVELVFLKGEWRDAQRPWTVRLDTSHYPEIARDELLTREQWEEKKKSYALQT